MKKIKFTECEINTLSFLLLREQHEYRIYHDGEDNPIITELIRKITYEYNK